MKKGLLTVIAVLLIAIVIDFAIHANRDKKKLKGTH